MKQALRPDFFFKSVPVLNDGDTPLAKNGATVDEVALNEMSQSKGWGVMKAYLEQLYRELGDTNRVAIEGGATMEEIGRNTVVITLTQGIIEKLINKVSDASDACKKNEIL